ncbi:Nif3-like dinuclear metal center hexameric protein [Bacteroidota bacterium]
MKLKDLISCIEQYAPLPFQESFDNSGLIVGNTENAVKKGLIGFDVTEELIDEAIKLKADVVITHHPLLLEGIKKITGKTYMERILIKAIKNDIAIYSAHTNLDSVKGGISSKLCEKLELQQCKCLAPKENILKKLVVFVPESHDEKVRQAIFNAGAGNIGDYNSCSFNIEGRGSFFGGKNTKPFVGEKGQINFEKEIRIETIFLAHQQNSLINAIIESHPYEEPAYDIYSIDNKYEAAGFGMIGYLKEEIDENDFLKKLQKLFNADGIRYSKTLGKKIRKVAVCGGSGSFLLQNAISEGADIFVTGDYKYHQFFEADNKILIADIGHFESEQVAMEIFYDILTKKIPNFALHLSKYSSNPINYL